MAAIDLLEPVLSGGIRNTNFFNGRLLSAEDLRQEQESNRLQHRRLGRAIGAGIVEGLVVTISASGAGGTHPAVTVTAGLGLNRLGQTLALPSDQTVALARAPEQTTAEAGLFAECKPPEATPITTGLGFYLLVLAPASGYEERALVSGLGNSAPSAPGCERRYAVEGIRFGLIHVNVANLSGVDDATLQRLSNLRSKSDLASVSLVRSLLAHLCLGTTERAAFAANPFQRVDSRSALLNYGALDSLRARKLLNDCDIPLALIYWTSGGIQFVDMGAVRRRPVAPPLSATWPLVQSERRLAEGEAALLQFQEHLDWLLQSKQSQSDLTALDSAAFFAFLPPLGFLPRPGAGTRGFEPDTFLRTMPHRPAEFIDGALLQALVRQSFAYEPIDTSQGELVWLYKTRQNERAVAAGSAPPYVIFTTGHMPPVAMARFDLARWDESNYTK